MRLEVSGFLAIGLQMGRLRRHYNPRTGSAFSMKTVHKSVLIWYSAEEMYALVTDVAKYPEFLPWCDRSKVVEQSEFGMTAEVGLAFSGFHQSFTTRNTHVPG